MLMMHVVASVVAEFGGVSATDLCAMASVCKHWNKVVLEAARAICVSGFTMDASHNICALTILLRLDRLSLSSRACPPARLLELLRAQSPELWRKGKPRASVVSDLLQLTQTKQIAREYFPMAAQHMPCAGIGGYQIARMLSRSNSTLLSQEHSYVAVGPTEDFFVLECQMIVPHAGGHLVSLLLGLRSFMASDQPGAVSQVSFVGEWYQELVKGSEVDIKWDKETLLPTASFNQLLLGARREEDYSLAIHQSGTSGLSPYDQAVQLFEKWFQRSLVTHVSACTPT